MLAGAGLLALPLASSGSAASTSSSLCAAVRSFDAVHPTSRAESVAALQALATASPTGVRKALTVIERAVQGEDPAAVLGEADAALAGQASPLAEAATTVMTKVDQTCHVPVHFLAAVPSGLSDQLVAPKVWARTICSQLSAWGQNLMDSGSRLLTPAGGVTVTLPEVRSELADFLDASSLRTQQLIDQLDEAGTPKVAAGHAIAAFVLNGVAHAKQVFMEAQPAAQALPDDPHAFQVAAQALVQTLDDTGRQVAALVRNAETQFKVRALDAALSAEAACAGIR